VKDAQLVNRLNQQGAQGPIPGGADQDMHSAPHHTDGGALAGPFRQPGMEAGRSCCSAGCRDIKTQLVGYLGFGQGHGGCGGCANHGGACVAPVRARQ
jgi:hypothetical protein